MLAVRLSIGCPTYTYIDKVGGGRMKKKEIQQTIIIVILMIALGGIGGMTLKSVYEYYGGPDYKVDCYIRYLNQREYGKIYALLSKASIQNLGGKDEIEDYYKKIYERENKLVSVDKIDCYYKSYKLKYQYAKGVIKDDLTVVKEKGGWKIQFPFITYEVEVFAPLGSKVYLDSKPMIFNQQTGKYELDHILPGTYLLKVKFQKAECKDYYKALYIPKEKSYEVPYETAHVKINCAPNLKVSLDEFNKVAKGNKVEFNDILLADYKIKVEDGKGIFEPQERKINVGKGENIFTFTDFELTSKGKKQLSQFIEAFYNTYIDAISSHSSKSLNTYFAGTSKQALLEAFSQWYIDKKDISQVNLHLQVGDSRIDERGQIHTLIRETAELYNKEYDEILAEEVVRTYKVILDVETTINILEVDWKVTERKILQSLVAMQDAEGKWVQY